MLDNINHQLDIVLRSAATLGNEYVLVGLILLLVFGEVFRPNKASVFPIWLSVIVAFGLVANLCMTNESELGSFFNDHIEVTAKTILAKVVLVCSYLLVLLFDLGKPKSKPAEYYVLLAGATLGSFVMVSANSFLTLYLGVELISLCSYLLVTFNFDKRAFEAGIKYLIFGSVSTAFMLYGMSIIYGLTGALTFDSLVLALEASSYALPFILLILGGLLFKISAFPYHIWVPDVYEAAPMSVTAYLSVVPKVAGVYAFYKLTSTTELFDVPELVFVISLLLMLSIAVGNFSALWQQNLKRLMAYSSIAHAGFMMMVVFSLDQSGFSNLTFYIGIYVFMNLCVFYLLQIFANNGITDMVSLNGLGRKYPYLGFVMLIALVALAGLPPTAGFTAKLLVFTSLWSSYNVIGQTSLLILFVFGLLNAVVSLYFYIRIAFHMFLKTSDDMTVISISFGNKVYASLLAMPLLIVFIKPNILLQFINTIISLGS